MNYVIRKIIPIVLLTICTFTLSGCSFFNSDPLKVGSESVNSKEFSYFLATAKSEIETQNNITGVDDASAEKASDDFWKVPVKDGKDFKKMAIDSAVEKTVEYKIKLKEAKNNKVNLTKDELDAFKKDIDSKVQSSGGQKVAEEQIKKIYGLSFDEFFEILTNHQIINKFIVANVNKIAITDAEMKDYYQKPENKEAVDMAQIVHVLFLTSDPSTGAPKPQDIQDAAKKKADAVLVRVKNGEDIKTIALELSEDSGVKQNSGEYTFFKTDGYVEEFKTWAFAAKPGDAGIVKTSFGYHVMKLIKKVGNEDQKVLDEIKRKIQNENEKKMVDEWKKSSKYKVVRNEDALKKFK